MLARIREIATAVALGAASVFSWSTADQDVAWELHLVLQDTNTSTSWAGAKRTVFNEIDKRRNGTILCVYSNTSVKLVPDGDSTTRVKPDKDAGVQVEHTWASKANWEGAIHFKRSSIPGADLHHLFAVRRGLNGSRGDKPFGEPTTEVRKLRIDTDDGTLEDPPGGKATGCRRGKNDNDDIVFEPRDSHKGNVARAMFYMSVRYWWSIPDAMEAKLKEWHTLDPVDGAERARNKRVEDAQGNRNPFIDEPGLVEAIDDF